MTNRLVGQFIVNNDKASDFQFTFRLTNNTDKVVHACKFGMPLETISNSHHIEVLDDKTNEKLKYRGVMRKRAPPSVEYENYVTINPGEHAQYNHTIKHSYTLHAGKRYRITTDNRLHCLKEYSDSAEKITLTFDVEPLIVTLQ
jgi:hypothetical protein